MLRALTPALLLAFLAVVAAPASANHVACGDTITQDTTLDSDLTCPGNGLVVGANGVTLDLGGHAISRSGAAFSTGITARQDVTLEDVTIRRGTIRGFDTGVLVEGGGGVAVRGLSITGNVTGIVIDISFDVVVRHNVIADNSGSGLLALDSNTVRVAGNGALRNAGDGIHFGGEVTSSVAEGNVASGNGDDGIEVAEFVVGEVPNTLARNLATFNGDLGIEAVAGTIDGGGNRAFGNGNPLQCLNITCK